MKLFLYQIIVISGRTPNYRGDNVNFFLISLELIKKILK